MDTSLKKQDTQPAGRRDDIHEIVYEEDAQEAPEVGETRVTSSYFDKIDVTDMHLSLIHIYMCIRDRLLKVHLPESVCPYSLWTINGTSC